MMENEQCVKDGSEWRRLVVLVGLPRSGTTVTTAVLGAHSDVFDVYEPWNAHKAVLNAAEPMSFPAFIERFAPPRPGCSTLLVKETSTSLKYIDRMVQILDEAPPAMDRHLILLLRSPFHVFLSECEARQRWWGFSDLVINLETFDKWAKRTVRSCAHLAQAAIRHNALCVSYDASVRDPGVMTRLMEALNLTPEDHRGTYQDRLDIERVRGDPKVTHESEAMHDRSIDARQSEWTSIRASLKISPHFAGLRAVSHQISIMDPLVPAMEATALIRAMKNAPGKVPTERGRPSVKQGPIDQRR